MKNILASCAVLTILLFPAFLIAEEASGSGEGGLIFCNTQTKEVLAPNGKTQTVFTDPCTYKEFIGLATRVINYLIYLAIPVAALSFAWAGFLILTAGGNMGQVTKGKEVFVKVAKGLFFILTAWLIVKLILDALFDTGYSILS